jgi:hypothetical protein
VRTVKGKRRLMERVLLAYREGDLHECIRRVCTMVEAAPEATAPRQLLAALYSEAGNGRLAMVHYRKLLPQAVARGELFRSVAIQKQLDSLQPRESLEPGRWASLQTQLRSHGLPYLVAAPAGTGRPWVEAQFLALPRSWFERLALETRIQMLGLEPEPEDVDAGTVWEVLTGRLRWSFALPDGRASAEALAAEGDAIHIDPELAPRARVTFVPELPVECLRFEATLTRDLKAALAASRPVTSAAAEGFTPETRALLPIRPRRREDLDVAPRAPTTASGDGPPRLGALPAEGTQPKGVSRDSGDWIEFGVLSLSDASVPAADEGAPPARDEADIDLTPGAPTRALGISAPADPQRERIVELPPPGSGPARKRGRPVVEPPGPVEMGDGLIIPPSSDPFAAPIPELGQLIERRTSPRVAVSFETRVALLRLKGSRVAPLRGELINLSPSGFGVRFAKRALGASRGALDDAVVAVELDIPGSDGPLRMAGQVRWIEVEEHGNEAQIGIEFVLMTEPERRRIAGTLASASLTTRDATRPAL